MNKNILKPFLILGLPITFLSSVWLKLIMKAKKADKNNIEDRIFSIIGILPVLDHYYQPLINPKRHLKKSLRDDRTLPGLDLNIREQLDILTKFDYNNELREFPIDKRVGVAEIEFFYNNGAYCSGDAEYLYNMIRHFKPRKIIEIGSGNSTLIAISAVYKNKQEDKNYHCEHICIEPYEMPWLETKNLKIIRNKVEDIDIAFFKQLESNDILFIDSSHIIRAQGDVLFEYLEILPTLKPGVIIHIHDIFTPKDYLDEWIYDNHFLWNEQYLLEAFLVFNSKFKVIGATNFLSHNFREEFSSKCPIFSNQPGREPGAFWMQKI